MSDPIRLQITPASRTYTNVLADQANQDYTAQATSGAFSKTSPAEAATGVSLSTTLSWAASYGATGYEYCYSSVAGPCLKWNSVGTNTSVTLNNVTSNYTYYWQVRAINAGGTLEANDGTWWSFTTPTTAACTCQ